MHDEHYITVLARLKPGVTRARADEEMTALGRWLETTYPKDNKERTIRVSQLMEELVGDYRPRLYVLLGAVAFVLLIACANIANLLLARGAARAREISDPRGDRRGPASPPAPRARGEPGARGRRRAAGAARGVLGRRRFSRPTALRTCRASRQAQVDGPVLAFAVVLTVLSGLVFGLAPALRTAARPPHEALKEGGPTGLPRRQPRPAAERAGRRRDRAGAGAPHRRGSPHPERRRAQQRGSGLRSSRSRGGSDLAARDVVPDTRSR